VEYLRPPGRLGRRCSRRDEVVRHGERAISYFCPHFEVTPSLRLLYSASKNGAVIVWLIKSNCSKEPAVATRTHGCRGCRSVAGQPERAWLLLRVPASCAALPLPAAMPSGGSSSQGAVTTALMEIEKKMAGQGSRIDYR
jgi:hypothetical protein